MMAYAGTRKGAEALGIKTKNLFIEKSELPEPFKSSKLNCAQLEDLLCMCKDVFNKKNVDGLTFDECCVKIFKNVSC